MDHNVSTDEMLRALANSRRRIVLRELADRSAGECSVGTLEETVARHVDRSTTEVQTRPEIAIRLRHVHLPVLDDAGLCEYDPDRERVAYVADEFVESLLECIDDRSHSNEFHC